jgi:hypothetical protein
VRVVKLSMKYDMRLMIVPNLCRVVNFPMIWDELLSLVLEGYKALNNMKCSMAIGSPALVPRGLSNKPPIVTYRLGHKPSMAWFKRGANSSTIAFD